MTINLSLPQQESEIKPRITVIGVGGAAYVYSWLRKRAGDPRLAFMRFAVLALLLSVTPDIGLLLSDQPGATGTSVAVLMSATNVVGAPALKTLRMPVRKSSRASSPAPPPPRRRRGGWR